MAKEDVEAALSIIKKWLQMCWKISSPDRRSAINADTALTEVIRVLQQAGVAQSCIEDAFPAWASGVSSTAAGAHFTAEASAEADTAVGRATAGISDVPDDGGYVVGASARTESGLDASAPIETAAQHQSTGGPSSHAACAPSSAAPQGHTAPGAPESQHAGCETQSGKGHPEGIILLC